MAYVTVQLNGVNMPSVAYPDGYQETRGHQEVFRELADGSVAQQLLRNTANSNLIVFDLEWKALTTTQLSTVLNAWNAAAGTTIVLKTPIGEYYNVRHNPQSSTVALRYYKAKGAEAIDVRLSLQTTEAAQVGP